MGSIEEPFERADVGADMRFELEKYKNATFTPNDQLGEAVRRAATKLAGRELGAVDDAIAALVAAGVPLKNIEIDIYPCAGSPVTVVRSK